MYNINYVVTLNLCIICKGKHTNILLKKYVYKKNGPKIIFGRSDHVILRIFPYESFVIKISTC